MSDDIEIGICLKQQWFEDEPPYPGATPEEAAALERLQRSQTEDAKLILGYAERMILEGSERFHALLRAINEPSRNTPV